MKELMQFLTEQGCTNFNHGSDQQGSWIEFKLPCSAEARGMVMLINDGKYIEGIEGERGLTVYDSLEELKESWLDGCYPKTAVHSDSK